MGGSWAAHGLEGAWGGAHLQGGLCDARAEAGGERCPSPRGGCFVCVAARSAALLARGGHGASRVLRFGRGTLATEQCGRERAGLLRRSALRDRAFHRAHLPATKKLCPDRYNPPEYMRPRPGVLTCTAARARHGHCRIERLSPHSVNYNIGTLKQR
eukprot:8358400-Pyramimonas_sp.AAC.2